MSRGCSCPFKWEGASQQVIIGKLCHSGFQWHVPLDATVAFGREKRMSGHLCTVTVGYQIKT